MSVFWLAAYLLLLKVSALIGRENNFSEVESYHGQFVMLRLGVQLFMYNAALTLDIRYILISWI